MLEIQYTYSQGMQLQEPQISDRLGISPKLIQINVKKILAVINATYVVAKRKPEKKIRLAGIRTLTSAIPVQRSNQLS